MWIVVVTDLNNVNNKILYSIGRNKMLKNEKLSQRQNRLFSNTGQYRIQNFEASWFAFEASWFAFFYY